jgi:integrase
VLAGLALAIRILSFAPIRIGNLAAIRIGENLIRPAGPNGPWWIVFPDYDVKNRLPLEFELDKATSRLIDQYLTDFRPPLTRGHRSDWLFPGEDGSHKGAATLSDQISARVHKATGVALTAHQFRHAAAAIFLKHRPGEYELVRRLLGHRSITTTTRFYAGLESLQATRIFGDIVESELHARRGEGLAGRPEDGDGRRRASKPRRRG